VGISGIVVTGAASGIGRASAEALVADGRGVALWDIADVVTAVADGLGMPGSVVDVFHHRCLSRGRRGSDQTTCVKQGGSTL
jgi:NAD(P)-dependent dehydrogenase (short-subunit alcohol dehydrogenase family)